MTKNKLQKNVLKNITPKKLSKLINSGAKITIIPKPPQKSTPDWVKGFDKRFPDTQNGYYDKDLKRFIRTLLLSQKKEMIERVKKLPNQSGWEDGDRIDREELLEILKTL